MFCNPLAESWAEKCPNYCMERFVVIYAINVYPITAGRGLENSAFPKLW